MNKRNTHILVIRLSAMGDVAMSVPVLRAFMHRYPDVKITVLSKEFLKPLFDDMPNVSFFAAKVNHKHKGLLGLYKLFTELKELKITHIADLHNVIRSKIIRAFFYCGGYKTAYINKGRREKKALTRTKNKVFKQLKTTHQRYADVFAKLGFMVDINYAKPVEKPNLSPEVIHLTENNYKKWIGIAPFATYTSKTYPLNLMEEAIKQLSEKNYYLFLFGGKSDAKVLNSIELKYKNVRSVAGKLNGLKNELNLISNLDIMLSMDSANAHFAAMQNVKTITLWGATHPYAGFAPFNQPSEYNLLPDLEKYPNLPCSIYGNKVCNGYENVMNSIAPSLVVKKIVDLLS